MLTGGANRAQSQDVHRGVILNAMDDSVSANVCSPTTLHDIGFRRRRRVRKSNVSVVKTVLLLQGG